MAHRLLLPVLAVLTLLGVQAQGLSITGSAQDAKGHGLSNVEIRVLRGKEGIASGNTDTDGHFSILVPSAGQFELIATHRAFAQIRRSVAVKESGPTFVRLIFPTEIGSEPAQPSPPAPPPPPRSR